MRVRRVPSTPKWCSLLDYLQLACLPTDDLCPYRPGDFWWIVFDGATPVAFAGVRPTRGDPSIWYLCRAGVIPTARGKGLQKRLLTLRATAARKAGARVLVTDTRPVNCASSNSLIARDFRTYNPAHRWACLDSIYWRKDL